MTPADYALMTVWVFGVLDQANEYRAIRQCRRQADRVTTEMWVLRRRAARTSLVGTASGLTLIWAIAHGSVYFVSAWFALSAILWAVADRATPGARPDLSPASSNSKAGAR